MRTQTPTYCEETVPSRISRHVTPQRYRLFAPTLDRKKRGQSFVQLGVPRMLPAGLQQDFSASVDQLVAFEKAGHPEQPRRPPILIRRGQHTAESILHAPAIPHPVIQRRQAIKPGRSTRFTYEDL